MAPRIVPIFQTQPASTGIQQQNENQNKNEASPSSASNQQSNNTKGNDSKRKRDEDPRVVEVTAKLKKLRIDENPWKLMDEMKWNDKSGKLYGKWKYT